MASSGVRFSDSMDEDARRVDGRVGWESVGGGDHAVL